MLVTTASASPANFAARAAAAGLALAGLALAGLALALAGCGAALPVSPVVTIAPPAVTLQAGGGSQQFTATVLNASDTSVVWRVNGVLGGDATNGTVSQSGLYQAPATAPAAGTITVQAVSVANDNSSASAIVTLGPAVGVSVTPPTATVAAGASQQFNATVTNASDTSVIWSVNGTPGGSAANGLITPAGLYTAPAAFPGVGQVTVAATSVQDPDISASAVVTLAQSVVVTISPATATVDLGATQAFIASVAGGDTAGVVWSVNGQPGGNATLGTIDARGNFTAPAQLPSPALESVTATSADNPAQSASAAVTIVAPVGITLTPATATLAANATQQFTATVTGVANTAVVWSVNATAGGNATVGTISPAGLYTAPASFPGLSSVSVGAASVADPAQTASALVTLVQPIVVTVTPATVSLNLGLAQTFAASVSGTTNPAVTWSVNAVAGGNATLGTIDASGNFLAPATLPAPATETITATSAADPTKSGSAQLTLVAPVTISISPASASLAPGATQQFTDTLANATNPAVTWSVNATPGGDAAHGTISATGLYTAPAPFGAITQVSVSVASVQDPAKSASAAVTLLPPIVVTVAPAAVTVNLGATQAFTATLTGTTNQAVAWSVAGVAGGNATLGTIAADGTFTAPAKLPAPALETITATSQADKTTTGTAQLTLQVPPAAFTLTPGTATLSLGKAESGSQTFQLALSAGFANPVTLAVSGLPVNVTAALDSTSLTASGPVTLTLTTASISLAQTSLPITLTAASTDAAGNPITQTATLQLTITGWAGHVHTLAGGPGGVGFEDGTGTADEMQALGLASDGGQNLYFADKRGTALRAFGLTSQTVTTLAGGPYNYTLAEGDGVVYDSANQTVYAADGLRNRIVAYAPGAYTVTVVAGGDLAGDADGVGAAASFYYPHGLALSADHTTLYVADTNNELIRKIIIATGAVTTLAGQHDVYSSLDGVGTAATFCQPTGLGIDAAGANLYVTDQCGYIVRRIALATATVSTVAGSRVPGQSDGPAASATFSAALGALAVDPHAGSNLLYVADGNEIRAVTLGTNPVVYTLAGNFGPGQNDGNSSQASFYGPGGLAALADAAGAGTTSLFISDTDNGLLRRMDILNPLTATSSASVNLTVSTIAGQPSHRGADDGVGTGAGFTGTSTATFSQPEGIVTDGKTAYVADSVNGAIRQIDLATTAVTTVAGPHQGFGDGPASAAAFFQNAGLAWVPSLNLIFIADTGNGAIRELNLSTQQVTTLTGTDQSGYADGSLSNARFNHPFGILASPDGTKLYIADTGNNAIRLVDLTAGTVTTIAGNGGLGSADGIGSAARFAEPNGLAFDSTGNNIYISDFENEAIRELNLATLQVTTLVGAAHQCGSTDGPAASATLCTPAFITTDGRSLFWGDSNTGLLRVLNLSTLQVSTLAGSPGVMHMADGDFTEAAGELTGPVRYNGVFGLAVAPDDSFILFTDKTANVIRIVN